MNDEDDCSKKLINTMISQLSEHWDTVVIMASRVEPNGNTIAHIRGYGNYYARVGMAKEFLDRDTGMSEYDACNNI